MDRKKLGRDIRKRRREMDMTQEALAFMAGISTSYLGHIERGTRGVTIETLEKLADCLGTKMSAWFE